MHRADNAARRVEEDVEEDNCQRHLLADDPEQDEDVGYHDGREELEEVLDPKVDDPEAPEVGGGEMRVGSGEKADRVERGDGESGEEEQPGHVAHVFAPQAAAHCSEEHDDPEEEAYREQYLPEAAEVQVLPALVAEPGPQVAYIAVDTEELPNHAPEDDHGQGTEQRVGEPVLAPGFAPGDHRGQ